jgi:CRISPR/Cas system Type II protein with McrA/HNH and RuvC-like nuclease domain
MTNKTTELYQGFSNYETFLVVLEIENDQQYLVTTRNHNNQDDFQEWVEESVVLPTDNTNPIRTDLINAALSRVNWQEAFLHLIKF